MRRRGLGIRQIARIVGYSAAWVSKLVRRLLSTPARPLTEHYHHQPQPASGVTRSLCLMLLYAHRLRCLLESGPMAQDEARFEALLRGKSKASYKARLREYVASVHQATDAVTATNILAGAFDYAEALSALPIAEAVRQTNIAYGRRYD